MFIREIISEGEVIQGNFPNNSSPTENFNIHVFMSPAPGVQPDWIPSKPGSIKDQYDLNKKIEDKTIVWFENSNQYLVLEPLVADIVTDLSENKDLDIIAGKLENNQEIPLKIAKDFIRDINDKILKPNITPVEKKPDNFSFKIPENFLFIKYYQINSKVRKGFNLL